MGGIYVKGMELPIQCVSCPFWKVTYIIKPMDICGAVPKKIEQPYGSRPEWCPLVEVPAHGRLIDGDKLEGDLRRMARYQDGFRQQGILGCCETIKMAPTIIPAEEDNNENHA